MSHLILGKFALENLYYSTLSFNLLAGRKDFFFPADTSDREG
jgi:hypothetical protein